MKRFLQKILTAVLVVFVAFAPVVINAEELTEDVSSDSDFGEPVEVIDYGDGWVGYRYANQIDPVDSIQLYSSTKTIVVPTRLTYEGSNVFTVTQYVTYEYGRSDGVVVVNNASGTVANTSTASYYAGSPTTSKGNGSPARVTTNIRVYRKSNDTYVKTLTVYLYLYNDGSYS